MSEFSVSVVLPAAGESARMGPGPRKPWRALAGEALLVRTLRRMRSLSAVGEIVLAAHPGDLAVIQGEFWPLLEEAGLTLVVAGGESRAESVYNALAVVDSGADLVAVHDAARPFPSTRLCEELFRVALARGAAVPVLPAADTLKRIEGDRVVETVSRRGLGRVQTPQVFRRAVLLEAFEYARSTGGIAETVTDDASLVEAHGGEVAAVLGEETNLKITTPRDLAIAEALIRAGTVEG